MHSEIMTCMTELLFRPWSYRPWSNSICPSQFTWVMHSRSFQSRKNSGDSIRFQFD